MNWIILLVISFVSSVVNCGPSDPEPRELDWWYERHDGFVQNTAVNGEDVNVLFYGDSITEGWLGEGLSTFNQYYLHLGTTNYGIGGDETQNLLWRILDREVDGLMPKLCVLKIGTVNLNELAYDDLDVANGVRTVVNQLREYLPEMRILLLGILPRNNAEMTSHVDNINSIIKDLDDGYQVRFHNMRDLFYRGDGQFNINLYSEDLIHLSSMGYAAWAENMDPLFREMLNTTTMKISL